MRLLRLLCVFALLMLTAAHAGAQALFRHPVVGAVTDHSADVSVWLDAGGSVSLEYAIDPSFADRSTAGPIEALASNDFVARFELDGLDPERRYHYRVRVAGSGSVGPVQSFKTLPREGADAPMQILFGSCQQRRPDDVGAVFGIADDADHDLFIQLGDWTYPDVRVPGFPSAAGSVRESYAQRFDTSYTLAPSVMARMGLAYVWDDHDYWKNNADGSLDAATKDSVIDGYRRYFPHYPLPNPNGIWQSFRAGNVEFFLIDSRSQRNPIDNAFPNNKFEPPAGHSMLAGYPISGVDQRTWLSDAIRRSTARWKVLVTPVFFNPGAKDIIDLADFLGRPEVSREIADKWVGYPSDVDSLRTLLREGHGRNLLIISGDAHVNVYDDGTRSLRPEFMVGNLDITTSDLFTLLAQYNITLWSAMQTGLNNTIGRLTVETTPVHRLVVESFDEDGQLELRYVMADSSAGSGVEELPDASRLGAQASVEGRELTIRLERKGPCPVTIELFDVGGRLALSESRDCADGNIGATITVALPRSIGAGTYLGRLSLDGQLSSFRIVVR